MFNLQKIIPWGKVWKKATTWINGLLAAAAVSYPIVATMKDDLNPWIVTVLAGMAALNIYLGNLKQSNLPPPLKEK